MKKLILAAMVLGLFISAQAWAQTPTPTPAYGASARFMADVEALALSDADSLYTQGGMWEVVRAAFTTTSDYGQIYDSANVMQTGDTFTYQPVAIHIVSTGGWINIDKGEYLTVTFDGGSEVQAYPPAYSGNSLDALYYLDTTGQVYDDRWLTQTTAGAAVPTLTPTTPTPTPIPTPSVVPPTPTPSPQPIPDNEHVIHKIQIYAIDDSGHIRPVLCTSTGVLW